MFVCRSWDSEGNHRQELKRELRMSNKIYAIRKGTLVEEEMEPIGGSWSTVCGVEKV